MSGTTAAPAIKLPGVRRLAGASSAVRVSIALGVSLFLTMLPVTMMVPVLRELVNDRFQVSTFWAHAFMSINMVAAVLASALISATGDQLRRRRAALLISLMLNAGVLSLMPVVSSFALFMSLRFVEGALHIFAITMIMAMASEWSTPERRGRQMGLIGSAMMFGTAVGVPLGGRIGQVWPSAVFYAGILSLLIAVALVVSFVRDSAKREAARRTGDTLALFRENRRLLLPCAFAFVDRFCVGVLVSSFVLYLGGPLDLSPSQRGGLLALFLVPFAVLCYPAGRLADRAGRAPVMIAGNMLFGLIFVCYGLVPASWLPWVMLASGLFSAALFAPSLAICAEFTPPHQRALAFGGFNLAGSLGFLCGPIASGVVFALASPRMGPPGAFALVFALTGLLVVVCTLALGPALFRASRAARAAERAASPC